MSMRDSAPPRGLLASLQWWQLGGQLRTVRHALAHKVVAELPHLQVVSHQRLFDRRCECVVWHPEKPGTVLVGSHGGDVVQWRVDAPGGAAEPLVDGKGKGGSVIQMKLDPTNLNRLAAVSHDQCVKVHDLRAGAFDTLHDTGDRDHWPTSVDVDSGGRVLTCDNLGWLRLFDSSGLRAMDTRLFKCKLQFVEFHPFHEHLFVTASNDKFISIFDLRRLPAAGDITLGPKRSQQAAAVARHQLNGIANSVHVCPHSGHTLLATCQSSELAVLEWNHLDQCRIYSHPNKFYQQPTNIEDIRAERYDTPLKREVFWQEYAFEMGPKAIFLRKHLSPIRATWHPLVPDMFVCGRYGGAEVARGVDVMQASTGQTLHHLQSPALPGVAPVNVFSPDGKWLVSCSGHVAHSWGRPLSEAPPDEAVAAQARRKGKGAAAPDSERFRRRDGADRDDQQGGKGGSGKRGGSGSTQQGGKGGSATGARVTSKYFAATSDKTSNKRQKK